MVSHNDAKAMARLRTSRLAAKLNTLYATKLDAKAARTYSDDADIWHGALSAPIKQLRPGQRDDEPRCSFARSLPAF